MASPKKINSISLSDTTLDDNVLVFAEFDKSALQSFLNSVTGSAVVAFFSGEGNDNGTENKLVLAALDERGKPSDSVQVLSDAIPCPPFC